MNNLIKIFALLIFLASVASAEVNYTCGKNKNVYEQSKSDSLKMNHKNMMKGAKKDEKKNPIVREGIIDVAAIDKNKDGKVYQDMMCWNVISDEAGDCPLCDMKLKEVTIDKAKKNLSKNNFKVKQ